MRFFKPVFFGDTIHTRTTITHKRAGMGRVVERTEVINHKDEVVLVADRIYIVERKPA